VNPGRAARAPTFYTWERLTPQAAGERGIPAKFNRSSIFTINAARPGSWPSLPRGFVIVGFWRAD
jgi:hypothetical protein